MASSKEESTNVGESLPKFTRAEVSQHNNLKETWIIIHNNVYDVTNFLNEVLSLLRSTTLPHPYLSSRFFFLISFFFIHLRS